MNGVHNGTVEGVHNSTVEVLAPIERLRVFYFAWSACPSRLSRLQLVTYILGSLCGLFCFFLYDACTICRIHVYSPGPLSIDLSSSYFWSYLYCSLSIPWVRTLLCSSSNSMLTSNQYRVYDISVIHVWSLCLPNIIPHM